MYLNNKNIVATKFNTKTNYQKASVLIEKKNVTLSSASYTKRKKCYSDDNIWIDTKPLNLLKN